MIKLNSYFISLELRLPESATEFEKITQGFSTFTSKRQISTPRAIFFLILWHSQNMLTLMKIGKHFQSLGVLAGTPVPKNLVK